MNSCVVCILRVLSCTYTTHCCCSICIWFIVLLMCMLLCVVAGYLAVLLLFVLSMCSLLTLERGQYCWRVHCYDRCCELLCCEYRDDCFEYQYDCCEYNCCEMCYWYSRRLLRQIKCYRWKRNKKISPNIVFNDDVVVIHSCGEPKISLGVCSLDV